VLAEHGALDHRHLGHITRHAGGRVVGTVTHSAGLTDFSAFVVQASSSGADVIGLANYSADLTNFLKQANEFGVMRSGKRIAAFVLDINNVRAVGLKLTQGLYTANPFYWDRDDDTRAFAARFVQRHPLHISSSTNSLPASMHRCCII
jgi:branched-chain amino acid transport system substrate-binding protein